MNPALTSSADAAAAFGPDMAEPASAAHDRHRLQRRKMLSLALVSWCVNASLIFLCAVGGTTPLTTGSLYLASGVALLGVFLILSELRISDRFKNHYLTTPIAVGATIIHLAFVYHVPQIGGVFLSALFIIFAVSTLRMSRRQAVFTTTLATALVAAVLFGLDQPISFPSETPVERVATLLNLALTFSSCIGLGVFGNTKRAEFYQRTLDLQAANLRIEELAQIDDLTGAFNRRRLMQILDDEMVRVQRNGAPFSVALMDLDHFKRINDRYGHPVGDEVLRSFAITVFANIRAGDRFGRYGGEEFLLLMPDTPRETAAVLLDRLRAIVADIDWSAHANDLQLTMSAGVSAWRANEAPDALLARADGALYRSKDEGRNRVTTV